MNDALIGWISAIISVIGTLYVNHKNVKGMIIWIISNILWIFYATFIRYNPPQIFMYVVFTMVNVHGIYKWRFKK